MNDPSRRNEEEARTWDPHEIPPHVIHHLLLPFLSFFFFFPNTPFSHQLITKFSLSLSLSKIRLSSSNTVSLTPPEYALSDQTFKPNLINSIPNNNSSEMGTLTLF
ncbi:hypothetical protein P8452_72305 [Trifolium repens]|nr:hypothetical protein P8452_72305 [Trifolium repens]